MLLDEKISKVNRFISKLKKKICKAISKEDYNTAMAYISLAGDILYQYNQYYADFQLEEYIIDISNLLFGNKKIKNYSNRKSVLFYDGFGMDTRGLAVNYLKALGKLGYEVIYVVDEKKKDKIERITEICRKYNFHIATFRTSNTYLVWLFDLINIFDTYMPRTAFFYTTPYDVAGIIAFHANRDVVDRFQIDLTDHAFWLGLSAFDYCLGGRDMAAFIQHNYRKIPKEKQIKIDVDLCVDEYDFHQPLPFDILNKKYIFSGGSLYKTLGDENNTYYKIISEILDKNPEIYFLYAGEGEQQLFTELISKYDGRVFLIKERKDFFYLIENCILYLNTYPMFGGMMMRYACLAKKIPITLKHGVDSDGILFEQEKRRIEYNTPKELIEDVNRLINDPAYLREREKLLDGAVMSSDMFMKNLQLMIEEHRTEFVHNYIEQDTFKFRKEFLERFNFSRAVSNGLIKHVNFPLYYRYPIYCLMGYYNKYIKH